MITSLHMRNFKCFQGLDLPLSKLTVLTGFNAAGKSTVLQTILLLAQTLRTDSQSGRLRLNGPLVRLGSPGDVINQTQGGSNVMLGVENEIVDLRWSFGIDDKEDRRSLKVESLNFRNVNESTKAPVAGEQPLGLLPRALEGEPAGTLISLLAQTVFLSAVRQTDTEVYPVPDDPKPVNANVGSFGEHAAWWLHQFDDLEIDGARCLRGSNSPQTLRGQVNAWAGEFFPGAEVNAQPIPETGLMRLQLRTSKTDNWRRPSNIGYGLTYAFPVLVAGLCAVRDQLVIIDSPEAHLHPHGQSRMGCFLAQSASGGQMLLETHSDHVLNGIRLAVRSGLIAPTEVSIYFFEAGGEKGTSKATRLLVDKNGNLDHWPEGFFDQSEKDLANLAGWE